MDDDQNTKYQNASARLDMEWCGCWIVLITRSYARAVNTSLMQEIKLGLSTQYNIKSAKYKTQILVWVYYGNMTSNDSKQWWVVWQEARTRNQHEYWQWTEMEILILMKNGVACGLPCCCDMWCTMWKVKKEMAKRTISMMMVSKLAKEKAWNASFE